MLTLRSIAAAVGNTVFTPATLLRHLLSRLLATRIVTLHCNALKLIGAHGFSCTAPIAARVGKSICRANNQQQR